MRRLHVRKRRYVMCGNGAAAVASLCCGVWLVWAQEVSGTMQTVRPRELAAATLAVERAGQPGLHDAAGHWVPLRRYERILSASTVSDTILAALSEPDRVLGWTDYSVRESAFAHLFSGKPTVPPISEVERIVQMEPDLVLVNSHAGRRDLIERLREVGLQIFDLGEMHGLKTLLPNIVSVATLLGSPERGYQLAKRLERRMAAVARHVPVAQRPRAMYVALLGDSLLGGTRGSSYHDVLTAAGLRDAAADDFTGWPRYTSDQVLLIDPEIIVTRGAMRHALCRHPGLDALRVCRGEGRIVHVDDALLGHSGVYMLEAAEALHEQVYGAGADDGDASAAARLRARPQGPRSVANTGRVRTSFWEDWF